jgi:hypothetical protein
MAVDYSKVNFKILFDSNPMQSVGQAFKQFSGAVIFYIFDLNSEFFQILLTPSSRRLTAFCTPFALFEFNRLPMGISAGSQGLTRVVYELLADVKGAFVFNYSDDLVYSRSVEEHAQHVRTVLRRLRDA